MPYAPGIQYVGDRYYNQAITGLGQNLAEGIANYRKTKEESEALNSGFEAMGRAMYPLLEERGIDRKTVEDLGDVSKFSGLSIGAKRAKFGQVAASFKMLIDEADKAERRREAARLEEFRNRTLGIQDRGAEERDRRLRETLQVLMNAAPPHLRAAGQAAPNADPELFLRLIEDDSRRSQAASPKPLPPASDIVGAFEAGGVRGAVNRMTGAMEIIQPDGAKRPGKGLQGRLFRNPITAEEELTITGELDALLEQYPDLRSKVPGATKSGATDASQTAPAYPKGKRLFQGGHLYEFDGKNWNPVR